MPHFMACRVTPVDVRQAVRDGDERGGGAEALKIASRAVDRRRLPPWMQFRGVTPPRERIAHAMQDESAGMFCDDANVDPALPLDQIGETDVVHVLAPVLAVMRAFVIQADHRLL